jgi:hypothetical protein
VEKAGGLWCGVKPGAAIDFTLDGGKYVILDARLVSHAR